MGYKSPAAGFGRAGERGVSYLVDKGQHDDKEQRCHRAGRPHR